MLVVSTLLGATAIVSVVLKHYFDVDTIMDYVLILVFALPCIFDLVLYAIAYKEMQYVNLICLTGIVALAITAFFVPELEGDPLILLL